MDQTTQLRQLIRESIQEYIREVETSGNIAAQEAKIRACEEAITLREKKANMEGLDEAYHDMMDGTKINELKKEIKELQKYKSKAEKVLDKMKMKSEGKTTKKMEDEGMEEGTVDEVNLDEYTDDPASGPQLEEDMNIYEVLHMQKLAGIISETEYKVKVEELEEAKKKMTAAQKDKKEDMKKSKSFGKSKDEKAKMYATATKLAKKDKSLKEQVQALFEDYSLQPIKSILSSNISPEEKMNQIGDFMTDTEEGLKLSNTNLGNSVDSWFSSKNNASKWLSQIQSLVSNPSKIKDMSSDLM